MCATVIRFTGLENEKLIYAVGYRNRSNEYNSVITNSVDVFIIYYPRVIYCLAQLRKRAQPEKNHRTQPNDIVIIIIRKQLTTSKKNSEILRVKL